MENKRVPNRYRKHETGVTRETILLVVRGSENSYPEEKVFKKPSKRGNNLTHR